VVDVSAPRVVTSVGLGAMLGQLSQAQITLASVTARLAEPDVPKDSTELNEVRWRVACAEGEAGSAMRAAGSPVSSRLGPPTMAGRLLEGAVGLVAGVGAWLMGVHSGWSIAAGLLAAVAMLYPVYWAWTWLDRDVGSKRAAALAATATDGVGSLASGRPRDLHAIRGELVSTRAILSVIAMSYLGRSTSHRDTRADVRAVRLATLDRMLSPIAWAELQCTAAIQVLDDHLAGLDA